MVRDVAGELGVEWHLEALVVEQDRGSSCLWRDAQM
jgi:hypothetical protein